MELPFPSNHAWVEVATALKAVRHVAMVAADFLEEELAGEYYSKVLIPGSYSLEMLTSS